jgi:putative ABC transport system permease protein
MALLVRTGADPAQLPPAIRQVVRSLDPDVPVSEFRLLDDIRSASLSTDRFRTILLGAFAGLALLLAAVGVYGVISYGVTQQSREIGIRMALGARRAEILRLVLGEGMLAVAVGLVVGVLAAAALSRFLGSLLYAVAPLDPSTFAAMSAVLTVVALAACLLPARRATRVDPVRAIRSE